MVIVSSGKSLRTKDFHEKKKKERRLKIIIFVSVLIALIAGGIYVLRLPSLQISTVGVSGVRVVKAQDVADIVASVIGDKYLFLIPKSNVLIYPRGEVRDKILSSIPRIRDTKIDLGEKNVLRVLVDERDAYGIYCRDVVVIDSPLDCYFLDEFGFIFDRSPEFSGEVYFVFSGGVGGELPGTAFLSKEEFEAVNLFREKLPSLGVRPRVLEKHSEEYHFILPNLARLVWNREDDVSLVYANLEAFLLSDTVQKDPTFLDRVLYLDLRTENKVFYRFQPKVESNESR